MLIKNFCHFKVINTKYLTNEKTKKKNGGANSTSHVIEY